MSTCPNCGAYSEPGSTYCMNCNYQLQETPQQNEASSPAEEQNSLVSGGGYTGAAGSLIMLIQNLMIVLGIVGILIAAGNALGNPGGAFDQAMLSISIIFFSFFVDYVGLVLIGIGIIALAVGLRKGVKGQRISSGTQNIGLFAGFMCIIWVILTVVWRIVYPQMITESFNSMIEEAFSLDIAAIDSFEAVYSGMQNMMYLWIGASIVLVVASFLFMYFLMKVRKEITYQGKLRSITWPIFTLINLGGTFLLASFILSALNLSLALGSLVAGLVIKGLLIPVMALYVYFSLTRKFLMMREPSPLPEFTYYPGQQVPGQPAPTYQQAQYQPQPQPQAYEQPYPQQQVQPAPPPPQYQQHPLQAQQPPPPPPQPPPAPQEEPPRVAPTEHTFTYCPSCNTRLVENTQFCPGCGRRTLYED